MLLLILLIFFNIGIGHYSEIVAADAGMDDDAAPAAAVAAPPHIAPGVQAVPLFDFAQELPVAAAGAGEPRNLGPAERAALNQMTETPLIRYLCAPVPTWAALYQLHTAGDDAERGQIFIQHITTNDPFIASWNAAFECRVAGPHAMPTIVQSILTAAILSRQLSVEYDPANNAPMALVARIPTDLFTPIAADLIGRECCLRVFINRIDSPENIYTLFVHEMCSIVYQIPVGAPGAGAWREYPGALGRPPINFAAPTNFSAPLRDTFDFSDDWRPVGLAPHMSEEFRHYRVANLPRSLEPAIISKAHHLTTRNPLLILHNWWVRGGVKAVDQFLAPMYAVGGDNNFHGPILAFYTVSRPDHAHPGRVIPTCLGHRELLPYLISGTAESRRHYFYLREHAVLP